MKDFPIDNKTYRAKYFNQRERFLVLHYTAENFKNSINSLIGKFPKHQVSSHYLVPDPTDATYITAGFTDLRIFNLVDESARAWHAGISAWENRNNLNDTSIGIEIVNQAADDGKGGIIFPPFNPQKILAVIQLCKMVLQRYPDISPTRVVAHADIAYGRKSDPGPKFPWKQLYDQGIGAWPEELVYEKYLEQFKVALPPLAEVNERFTRYGYQPSDSRGNKPLIAAFQIHFRPAQYTGVLDAETAAILYALCDKYKNSALGSL